MGLMMKSSIKYVCHIGCSHHADGVKYLGELENEYYALRAKGYSGEGFHSDGKRLGQGVSHNVPLNQAKSKAVLAAEKRKRMAGIMDNSGGRKLGGNTRIQAKSPRELAAEVRAS
jgi:DNA-dependent metalloprotease WSS1